MSHKNLELIKLKRTLEKHKSVESLQREITNLLFQIPNVNNMVKDPELILYVCNMIENNSYHGSQKLDKRDICIKVLISLNPEVNNDNDLNTINKMIEFLHSNGKIKKLNSFKKYGGMVGNWLLKKFA